MVVTESKNDSSERILIPAGTHHAICYGFVGIGTQNTGFKNKDGSQKWENQGILMFEFPFVTKEFDGITKPLVKNTWGMKLSLGNKEYPTKLRKVLTSWFGKTPNGGVDMKKLLGQNALIGIVHTEKGENTYDDLDSISAPLASMEKLEPFNEFIYYEIDTGMVIPDGVPEYWKIKIFESREMFGHSREDETGQQNDGPPPEVAASERVTEQMVNEEFGVDTRQHHPDDADDNTPF